MYLANACGEKPSVRNVAAAIKAIRGRGMRSDEVRKIMYPAGAPSRDTVGTQAGNAADTLFVLTGHAADTPGKPTRARSKEYSRKPISSPNGDVPKARPEWAVALEAEVDVIGGVALRDLSVVERLALGRYHAMRFENFSVAEQKNRNRGASHASKLAAMGRTAELGAITVGEYIDRLDAFQALSKSMVRNPWELRAALETVPDRSDELQVITVPR